MMSSDLVNEKQERPGLFGWLGADTFIWRIFWIFVFTVYGLHYILAFFFHYYISALLMVWLSLIVGVLMVFILAILGGADLVKMVKASKEVERLKA